MSGVLASGFSDHENTGASRWPKLEPAIRSGNPTGGRLSLASNEAALACGHFAGVKGFTSRGFTTGRSSRKASALLPVTIAAGAVTLAPVEVVLASGVTLRVSAGCDAKTLRTVLDALENS